MKVFYTSLTIPWNFSQSSRWVKMELKSIWDWLEDSVLLFKKKKISLTKRKKKFFRHSNVLCSIKEYIPSTECLFKRKLYICWANTSVQDIWQMLFEFYWLRSWCLSPFTSQWAQRWPLCSLGAPYVIGPNTIKCTFSIWGSKRWQPLRCPYAQRGPTHMTSSTWTMTLIYKQVASATTTFTRGQLRSMYSKQL